MSEVLRSSHLVLKPITRNDFDEILDMFAEPDAFEFIQPLQNKSEEEHREYLEHKLGQVTSGEGEYWVIRTQTDAFVGCLNLTPMRHSPDMNIGWQVIGHQRSKGYAYEAAQLVLDHAVERDAYDVIYGIHEDGQEISRHMFHKLRFKEEGIVEIKGEKLYKYSFRLG